MSPTRPSRASGRSAAARATPTSTERVRNVISPRRRPGSSGTTTRKCARARPRASLCTSGWRCPCSVAPLTKTIAGHRFPEPGRTTVAFCPATTVSSARGVSVEAEAIQLAIGVSIAVARTTNAAVCSSIHEP